MEAEARAMKAEKGGPPAQHGSGGGTQVDGHVLSSTEVRWELGVDEGQGPGWHQLSWQRIGIFPGVAVDLDRRESSNRGRR